MRRFMPIFLAVVVAVLTPVLSMANPEHKAEDVSHRVPAGYAASVQTLAAVKQELHELAKSYRLYQFHEPLELFDAIIDHLGERADRDIYVPMRSDVRGIASAMTASAERLDGLADAGDGARFASELGRVEGLIGRLDRYAGLSNESHVSVAHNVPPSYRRVLNRMRGVRHALNDVARKGYLYKAHEDIQYLEAAAQALDKVFEANVIAALQAGLERNLTQVRDFSHALHQAGDTEDREAALHAFTPPVTQAIHALERLGAAEGGHSPEAVLDRADRLFAQRKLLQPEGDNAYVLYRRVLAADPGNQRARMGIENIVAWYLHRIEELAEQGDWNRASIYSRRVLSIEPDNEKAQGYYRTAQARHHH